MCVFCFVSFKVCVCYCSVLTVLVVCVMIVLFGGLSSCFLFMFFHAGVLLLCIIQCLLSVYYYCVVCCFVCFALLGVCLSVVSFVCLC